jgi:hypothetical protein
MQLSKVTIFSKKIIVLKFGLNQNKRSIPHDKPANGYQGGM